jgi:hydrogenase maturation protease
MQAASDTNIDSLVTTPVNTLTGDQHTLVLAVGNLLMTDEGAGIHTLNYLIEHNEEDDAIEYMDGGTLSFSIAAHIENADHLIVIDAAELHAAPGTVQTFEGDNMIAQLGSCKLSVHEVGLIDLMDMVRLNDRFPKRHALVGIQPLTIADWSDQPSEPVAAAVPKAAAEVNRLIKEWSDVA